jgi:hypothetical protein
MVSAHLIQQLVGFRIHLRQFSERFVPNKADLVSILKTMTATNFIHLNVFSLREKNIIHIKTSSIATINQQVFN